MARGAPAAETKAVERRPTLTLEQVREAGWRMLPEQVQDHVRLLLAYKLVMLPGEDYGVIPGTDRPTLLQPGADTLCNARGLVVSEIVDLGSIEDWAGAFFHYRVKLALRDKETGAHAAWGVGSANSREKRYQRGSWVPWFTLSEAEKALSEEWAQEWRTSKAGKKYKVVKRQGGEDVYSLVNTIEKMAVKRAYVSATLRATGAHRIFTQDVEDMGEIVEGEVVAAQTEPAAEPMADTPEPHDEAKARYDLRQALRERYGNELEAEALAFVSARWPQAVASKELMLTELPGEVAAEMLRDLKASP